MHSKRSVASHQRAQIGKHAANSDSYTFFNLLTGPELLGEVESLLPEHRIINGVRLDRINGVRLDRKPKENQL